jgi:hypothetical protein
MLSRRPRQLHARVNPASGVVSALESGIAERPSERSDVGVSESASIHTKRAPSFFWIASAAPSGVPSSRHQASASARTLSQARLLDHRSGRRAPVSGLGVAQPCDIPRH